MKQRLMLFGCVAALSACATTTSRDGERVELQPSNASLEETLEFLSGKIGASGCFEDRGRG
jgi:hypothetical protein